MRIVDFLTKLNIMKKYWINNISFTASVTPGSKGITASEASDNAFGLNHFPVSGWVDVSEDGVIKGRISIGGMFRQEGAEALTALLRPLRKHMGFQSDSGTGARKDFEKKSGEYITYHRHAFRQDNLSFVIFEDNPETDKTTQLKLHCELCPVS